MIGLNLIAIARNYGSATPIAVGTLSLITGDIAGVDIPQSRIQPYLPSSMKGLQPSRRKIPHSVRWIKAANVPGSILTQLKYKLSYFPQLTLRVIEGRDN